MNIFFLEDNPYVFPIIPYIRDNGHSVSHAINLTTATYCLRTLPGATAYDRFLFDVALPPETVYDPFLRTYNNYDDFNGLYFLLNNLDILGDSAFFADRIAIVTALRHKVVQTRDLNVFGKRFIREELSEQEIQSLISQDRVPKIRYKSEQGRKYTFSILDKGGHDIIGQIDRFIKNG